MSEDTPLLQAEGEEAGDDKEEKIDYKQMVWFHGKELATKSSLVRLGVGKDGFYKLDSKTAKLLKHWTYSEIKDFNYSGYSFTLQLKTESDYFVRTDDGEAICSYIEAFQKDPAAALEHALNHPPMSQIPESGVLTLRKKFTSDQRSPANDIKYYTLNRRTKKNASTGDPLKAFNTNLEVDSRLIADYNQKSIAVEPNRFRAHSHGSKLNDEPKTQPTNEIRRQKSLEGYLDHTPVNGVRDKAEDTHIHKVASDDKRHSNGILTTPVSTKGEVTMIQSTKISPHKTSPLTQRKVHTTQTSTPQITTTSLKATPLTDVKTEVIKEPEPPKTEIISPPQKIISTSDDKVTLLGRHSNSSSRSSTQSPPSELQIIRQAPNTTREGSREPLDMMSNALEEVYDRLEGYNEEYPTSPPGSDSTASAGHSEQSVLEIQFRSSLTPESEGSGTYDHLPPTAGSSESITGTAPDRLSAISPSAFQRIRRNISQPALSTPVSARESPIDRERSTSPIIEESSDEAGTPTNSDDEIKIGQDEGKTHFEQVKLREKKPHPQDPFADLLSPKSNTRLRWSKELNPLYDFIKGFKISDSVKLYDTTPSKLLESKKASDVNNPPAERSSYKPTSSIIIEESELSHTQANNPLESTVSSPTLDTNRPLSSFSETTSTSPTDYQRRSHHYEEIQVGPDKMDATSRLKGASLINQMKKSVTEPIKKQGVRAATLNLSSFDSNTTKPEQIGRSPRIGKRELQQQQRKSRTIGSLDDTETVKRKQKPVRASDELKDFSSVMREYRLFFIKLPNGILHREIFSISKPVAELKDRACDILGVDNPDHYLLYVEGACLTTLKESDSVTGDLSRNRSGSLNHLVDSHSLPDQGSEPLLLKSQLSLRMQGITTSRILNLIPDDEVTDSSYAAAADICTDIEEEFPKDWLSIVQGITPVSQDNAVKLAALQYQAYFLDRTAVHSTVGFCRPTEFLPVEYASVRGVEQKMYREQEALKSKSHSEVHEAYTGHCARLPLHNAVFFPVREPRKKLLQSTKLKPVLLGVSPKGILRVDPKTKEVLDFWDFMVLKNWAYSKRTFVLAFANKNYPVECNQSKWISQLVDFHVESLVGVELNAAP